METEAEVKVKRKRKSKKKKVNKSRLHIYIPQELINQIEELKDEMQITRSAMIQMILQKGVKLFRRENSK